MAINPPSDLVLDVVRAADPQAYRASVEKLKKNKMVHSGRPQFDVVSHSPTVDFMRSPAAIPSSTMPSSAVKDEVGLENPHRKFEAFMLQSFIMDMFTSDTSSVFGKGAGADFWKGLLAEKMADEMAQGGGIGIAALLDERAEQGPQARKISTHNDVDAAAASVVINKNQINFMRYMSRGNPL